MKATPTHVYWCAKHGADYVAAVTNGTVVQFCAQCMSEAMNSLGNLEMPNPKSPDRLIRNLHTRLRRERRIIC